MCILDFMKILIVFLLAILALMSLASAETIIVGNYTVAFDFGKPHEVSVGNHSTLVLKIFDGRVEGSIGWGYDIPEVRNVERTAKQEQAIQYVQVSGQTCELISAGDHFALINEFGSIPFVVLGQMPFLDLSDFLKTLKIERKT